MKINTQNKFSIFHIIFIFILIILICMLLNNENKICGGKEKNGGSVNEDFKLKEKMRTKLIKSYNLNNKFREVDHGPDFHFYQPIDIMINGKKQLVNWVSLEPYNFADIPIILKHLTIKLEKFDDYGIGCFIFPNKPPASLQLDTLKGNLGCFLAHV